MTQTTDFLMELDALKDEELQEVITKAQENIYNRAVERQKRANADAKAIEKKNKSLLKSAGVTVHRKQKREMADSGHLGERARQMRVCEFSIAWIYGIGWFDDDPVVEKTGKRRDEQPMTASFRYWSRDLCRVHYLAFRSFASSREV
jgi:hypothetical protein